MQFLVSGTSGMIGSAVVSRLIASGHHVLRLSRSHPPDTNYISWNPELDRPPELPDVVFDAVIHLAGENIGAGRWSERKKARIRDSRVKGAQLLCQSLASLRTPPRAFLCASAVGYYGNRGDEILREESRPGTGFLAKVCQELETEITLAAPGGTRVVIFRFGMVLSEKGGALAMMLRPFRLGLGGVLGSGRQYMSWIVLEDAIRVIEYCLGTESIKGPVIAASPQPVRNREFVKTLGKVLKRPAVMSIPSVALRLILGEMADEVLLASQRVQPARLESAGFVFNFPELQGALHNLLCRGA